MRIYQLQSSNIVSKYWRPHGIKPTLRLLLVYPGFGQVRKLAFPLLHPHQLLSLARLRVEELLPLLRCSFLGWFFRRHREVYEGEWEVAVK